jgi:glycine/sarcosine N-methyltransferase
MRQSDEILRKLLPAPNECGTVLDCAAGMGTQAIGLAKMGFAVEGCDGSEVSIGQARRDAERLGLPVVFRVDDIRPLEKAPEAYYGVALAMDNVLPQLGDLASMRAALNAMFSRLHPGGMMVAGVRDYDLILAEHPMTMPPRFSGNGSGRRIFHEVWDWLDDRRYVCHIYITNEIVHRWEVRHFTGEYCAVLKCEMADLFREVGCEDVQILAPEQTGYHYPLIRGQKFPL